MESASNRRKNGLAIPTAILCFAAAVFCFVKVWSVRSAVQVGDLSLISWAVWGLAGIGLLVIAGGCVLVSRKGRANG